MGTIIAVVSGKGGTGKTSVNHKQSASRLQRTFATALTDGNVSVHNAGAFII